MQFMSVWTLGSASHFVIVRSNLEDDIAPRLNALKGDCYGGASEGTIRWTLSQDIALLSYVHTPDDHESFLRDWDTVRSELLPIPGISFPILENLDDSVNTSHCWINSAPEKMLNCTRFREIASTGVWDFARKEQPYQAMIEELRTREMPWEQLILLAAVIYPYRNSHFNYHLEKAVFEWRSGRLPPAPNKNSDAFSM